MRSGNWMARLLAMTALTVALEPTATSAQGSPSSANPRTPTSASRRLPHSLTPKTLTTRWPTPGESAGTSAVSPSGIATALGLPVEPSSAAIQRVNATVSHNLAASQPNVVTQAMEPIEAMPATPETMRYSGYGEPFHDFTQLPVEGPGCSGCGGECDGSCAAGSCGCGPEILPGMAVDHLSFFGGVHGFKNGGNRGQDGSFGFQEGFNFGTSARNVIFPPTVGLQFGLQATQSNLDGAAFTTADRNQIFMTVGGFRRADCGLQGGLVFDYLWDDWYYDLSVGQVRGEASVAISSGSSYGLWFTAPVQDDVVSSQVNGATLTESWETMDIYALFFRSNLLAGGTGEGRLYAGMTGGSDGIVGAESRLPLMNGWALETEFAYLIPNEPTGDGANETEAWNLGINLVWYPGSLACGQCIRYHRPMFDVANNGSLILRAK